MRWTSLIIPAALAIALGCENDEDIAAVEEEQVVAELKVSPTTARLYVGGELQLSAEPLDRSGRRVRGAVVYWTTYDTEVLSVGRSGRVIGKAEGSATLRARCHGIVDTAVLTVELDPARPVVTVRVAPDSLTLQVGATAQLNATALDGAGRHLQGAAVSWSSSDESVANVTGNGRVTGVGYGTATIVASSHGIDGVVPVEVEPGGAPPNPGPGTGTPFDAFGLHWTFAAAPGSLGLFYDVWGSSPNDVFAVGTTRLWDCCPIFVHFDGTSWTPMPMPALLTEFTGVWGSSHSDVFAVGGPYIYHYDGTAWQEMDNVVQHSLNAVWGSSAADVFAVGSAWWSSTPAIFHYDGVSWSVMETPAVTGWLGDVWGSSGTDVFAVGGGTIMHYDGNGWSEMSAPDAKGLMRVWGSSARDVFATGVEGVILHYDGSTWAPMQSPTTLELAALWGNGPDDVYAAGTKNWWPTCCSVLLHYDGNSWRVVETTTGHYLLGMWGTPEVLFIAGSMGVLQGRR